MKLTPNSGMWVVTGQLIDHHHHHRTLHCQDLCVCSSQDEAAAVVAQLRANTEPHNQYVLIAGEVCRFNEYSFAEVASGSTLRIAAVTAADLELAELF